MSNESKVYVWCHPASDIPPDGGIGPTLRNVLILEPNAVAYVVSDIGIPVGVSVRLELISGGGGGGGGTGSATGGGAGGSGSFASCVVPSTLWEEDGELWVRPAGTTPSGVNTDGETAGTVELIIDSVVRLSATGGEGGGSATGTGGAGGVATSGAGVSDVSLADGTAGDPSFGQIGGTGATGPSPVGGTGGAGGPEGENGENGTGRGCGGGGGGATSGEGGLGSQSRARLTWPV